MNFLHANIYISLNGESNYLDLTSFMSEIRFNQTDS